MYVVKFKEWVCVLVQAKYRNNDRIALELEDLETGEPVATATVNVPEEHIEDDEVIIKSYSGNEGMYEALVEQGVISESIRTINVGWVTVNVCKLLIVTE